MESWVLRWPIDPAMTLPATTGSVLTLTVAQVHRAVP
jgi:hypothetical protein